MFLSNDPKVSVLEDSVSIQDKLRQVNPAVLKEKISEFRKLDFSCMDDARINRAILDVLCWNNMFCCCINMRTYPARNEFFRVKQLDGTNIPNKRFSVYEDFWETNPKYLKSYGRLNKPGEPLLYVSPSLYCAVNEVHIKCGEPFVAIKYTAKSEIKVNLIGGSIDYQRFGIDDEKAIMIHEMYNDFLREEFSRDVGEKTRYLYRISEAIAKSYFDLPPRVVQDAWAYSSVKDKTEYNVCFRPDIAHELLKLNGAMICKLNCKNEVQVLRVAVGADEQGKILFYPVGSPQQKEAFPEISYQ